MNKGKDWFYNSSDIFTVLLIIIIASFIIWGRIDSIMAYPETLVSNTKDTTTSENTKTQYSPSETDTSSNIYAPDDEKQNASDSSTSSAIEKNPITVIIPDGTSGSGIAKILKEKGLIEDADLFLTTVANMGKETKLKSGTFTIQAGSDIETIVQAITN